MIEDGGAQSIYVGDTHQQLYSWRGAVDAMRRIDADVRLRLTRCATSPAVQGGEG
jgi:hypothetical protein